MFNKIYRCYTEKRPGFDIAAKALKSALSEVLKLPDIGLRLFNRYDVQGFAEDRWQDIINIILSEPMSDLYYEDNLPEIPDGSHVLCTEPLPGRFDVRADSCGQCIQMLLGGRRPAVKTALVYVIGGAGDAEFIKIKDYLINPLEYRETPVNKFDDLPVDSDQNEGKHKVCPYEGQISGFTNMDAGMLEELRGDFGLAMTLDDILLIREYFKSEQREPTETELRVFDTYWSDHCRHTTFNTIIKSADIKDKRVKKAYDLFCSVNGGRPVTLMNTATVAMKYLREQGGLKMLDVSEENNACTVKISAEFDHGQEDWLLFFKNETHNHPTEIEPYGGASTCIGGAIRDPLSGRAYVYQAMRITGSGDPNKPFEDTLPGKLPQRKLTVTAANGFSSYGNQIGIATGLVREFYHEGYIAKRLEAGAVIGAAPAEYVKRGKPAAGDVIVILGGRTGRDGIGGATGSSKTHGASTVSDCAAEVQKGSAPEERKLQRLFKNPDVTRLIKRCNDFGAGGAAVAIGELASGVEIDLDAMPVKYRGLTGTELAISESQERMAAVVAEHDAELLIKYAEAENIEAVIAARVMAGNRLVMNWRGEKIADIKRDFLDTNGAERYADVYVPEIKINKTNKDEPCLSLREKLLKIAGDINFCSQKGLVERFDSSIGASSVFMPYGGKYALSESQVMAALLPAYGARTASVMAYGFDPYFTESDPFGGSVYAVVSSIAKLVAAGVSLDTIYLSLQEYFPRANDDAERWGLPFAAMLGAFEAQMGLKIAAIGGKDSMSGSFGDLDVPPTLISFAAGISRAEQLISTEFKNAGSPVYLLEIPVDKDGLPDYCALRDIWAEYTKLCRTGKVLSAWACESGGVYGGIMKMSFGNMIGFAGDFNDNNERQPGSVIFESGCALNNFKLLGYTQAEPVITSGSHTKVPLAELLAVWQSRLEGVFPVNTGHQGEAPIIKGTVGADLVSARQGYAKPKAVIPVFPGTNCEYDTAAAIERAGGLGEIVLVRNLTPEMLYASVSELETAIKNAQMIIFPGGFSGGDEPDGSGKFIVSLFCNERLKNAVHELLYNRDGLILGICNGFQALIKTGLLPNGQISAVSPESPTLTFNNIGRHQSKYIRTSVASVNSPWLSKCKIGEVYIQPVSHGEGRFTAPEQALEKLKENGQIALQYADYEGMPSMDTEHNPNGSVWAVEGITSPDGRVLGKMAHSERYSELTAVNIPGNKFMPLFEGGVNYFK
ncbi:MAG: phosphoribosylformylglycinamidine synthase [Oscillospiraceae bacterium]|nr:phosphoribosylformylglycinamidine synthase [Oscillospiraceae bacterium]